MVLKWRELDARTPDGRRIEPTCDIIMVFPDQIRARSGLLTDIRQPLLHFFEDLAVLQGDWSEERILRDSERQFSIACWSCYQSEVCFEVSLAADYQDPAWTVELSLYVPQGDLPEIVERLRRFCTAAGP